MASSSATFNQKPSTQILTNLHSQLSTVLQNHTPKRGPCDKPSQLTLEGDISDQIEHVSEPTTTKEEHGEDEGSETLTHQCDSLKNLLNNIDSLIKALAKTMDLEDKLNKPIQTIQRSLNEVLRSSKEAPMELSLTQKIEPSYLNEISNDIKQLKFHISTYQKLSFTGLGTHMNLRTTHKPLRSQIELPDLHGDDIFKESPTFKEILQVFEGFEEKIGRCFLYFAAFPENAVLKKRFLMHWWVGEGLLDPSCRGDETPENLTGRILQEFTDKGLIIPIKEDQKKIKKRFKLSSVVRSAVIILAKEKGLFDFDSEGNPIANSKCSDKIFLVKAEGSRQPEPPIITNSNLEEKIEVILNVNEPFPDSVIEWWAKKGKVDIRTVKVVEWLLKMKNLKVLYLGRWQSALEEHHIEVESTEFLKGLKNMKKLRLLSLQGISWITELPNSIKKLSNLRVLDLKSCHNLEKLPEGIRSLKRLTHLDVSGCYLLDWMPKGMSALTEIRVLKGFVVGKSSLSDLKGLKKLRKLSVSSSREDFPDGADLYALKDLEELRNLTIVWGATTTFNQPPATIVGNMKRLISKRRMMSTSEILELPETLEKLDLQCLPQENLPTWLNPSSLKSLKKLYIRGGKLKDLGNDQWAVEILRLKFLTDLKMEWRKLLMSFPNLNYLQRVKCPRVTFCPCDENGVWMKLS